ncbi:hypothetical protein MTO96_020888 [Rhipicephalus appendiculatus]
MQGAPPSLPQPFCKAPVTDNPGNRSSATESCPDAEGFQAVTTKEARCPARVLAAAAALPVDPIVLGMVLVRPKLLETPSAGPHA